MSEQTPTTPTDAPEGRLTFVSVLLSTLGAAFGVQSRQTRERDFASGSFWPFVVAGVLFTAVFVGGLMLLVQLILSSAP